MTIPAATRRSARSLDTSAPSNLIDPELSALSPETARSSVVLPAPLAPIMACTSPAVTLRLTPCSARNWPWCTVRSLISSSAPVTARPPAPARPRARFLSWSARC